MTVALFTRAWIEISSSMSLEKATDVALFTRAWIEIIKGRFAPSLYFVALFTRAWIEITAEKNKLDKTGVAHITRAGF